MDDDMTNRIPRKAGRNRRAAVWLALAAVGTWSCVTLVETRENGRTRDVEAAQAAYLSAHIPAPDAGEFFMRLR